MFIQGLIDEAVSLKENLSNNHQLLYTMGYKEALLVNDKKISLQKAKERILSRQNGYAKRQYTWFKKEKWWQKIDPYSVNVIDNIIELIS